MMTGILEPTSRKILVNDHVDNPIRQALLEEIPDTVSLFWVDFMLEEIFPP